MNRLAIPGVAEYKLIEKIIAFFNEQTNIDAVYLLGRKI